MATIPTAGIDDPFDSNPARTAPGADRSCAACRTAVPRAAASPDSTDAVSGQPPHASTASPANHRCHVTQTALERTPHASHLHADRCAALREDHRGFEAHP